MEILKIPTDNLYKFLAVSGLVLFLACGYLAFFYGQNLERLWSSYNEQINDMNAYIGKVSEEAESPIDTGDTSKMIAMFDMAKNSPERARQIINKQESASEKLKNLELAKNFQENYGQYLYEETKRIRSLSRRLWVGAIIGLIFSAIGFLSWYFKVQRHLDKKLLLSAQLESK